MLIKMALFGKKKKNDEMAAQAAENKQSNSVTDEMKVILEAREEAQQEKEALALERQQEQEEAGRAIQEMADTARKAAEKILNEENFTPAGMTFFMLCDEIPMGAAPEKEGNIIVRGDLRGTAKVGTEIYLYQGYGEKYTVKIEKIRNDDRVFVDEASYERVEMEITTGDLPAPIDPDQDASRPVKRFAVLTDAKGIEDTKDPACRGMAAAGNPRTLVMLCEYGRFGKDPEYFTLTMDAIMTSEFVTPVKIVAAKNGKSSISFAGVRSKQDPDASYLPVFTDNRLVKRAQDNGFGGGLNQRFALSFAQTAAISRDDHHQGFLINPGGPVTITIPTKLINDMVKQKIFKERFGEGAADNASLALGGTGNTKLDEFIGKGGPDMSGIQKIVITNPTNTPEFLLIEKAVKTYCGSHAAISKLMILISAPEADKDNQTYFTIVDCAEDKFQDECKGLAEAMKPYMKTVKTIRFQLFDKLPDKEVFAKRSKWLYSKLPI